MQTFEGDLGWRLYPKVGLHWWAHAQAALKQRREDLLASQLQARRPVMEAARSSRESLDERF